MLTRRAAILLTLLAAGCSSGGSSFTSPSAAPGPLTFTFAPVDPAVIQFIVPLGNMGPSAHTMPTDHIYFYHHLNTGPFAPVAVLAPASGTVTNVLTRGTDSKVWIRVNGTYTYYFDHVTLAPGVSQGARIDAGSRVGDSTGIAFDFSVLNAGLRIPFVNPARYGQDTYQADAPLKYFEEPIRGTLYSKVRRVGSDLDGRINYDVPGTLSGGWFADDLAVADSTRGDDPSFGMRQLAFARDAWFPDRLRISVGGFDMTGLYGVPNDTADFSTITPSSGVVTYRLLNLGEPGGAPGTDQLGLLVVQMLDATRIRVDVLPVRTRSTAEFTSTARIYLR